jgi:hypothetical protein
MFPAGSGSGGRGVTEGSAPCGAWGLGSLFADSVPATEDPERLMGRPVGSGPDGGACVGSVARAPAEWDRGGSRLRTQPEQRLSHERRRDEAAVSGRDRPGGHDGACGGGPRRAGPAGGPPAVCADGGESGTDRGRRARGRGAGHGSGGGDGADGGGLVAGGGVLHPPGASGVSGLVGQGGGVPPVLVAVCEVEPDRRGGAGAAAADRTRRAGRARAARRRRHGCGVGSVRRTGWSRR